MASRSRSPNDSWRTGKTTAERGYGARWQKARETFLSAHPLCAKCEAKGRVTQATVVNHKVAHRGDWSLFWDSSNWEPLCKPHHDSDAQREDRGGTAKLTYGPDGWPIA